jgi:hypothetical protein
MEKKDSINSEKKSCTKEIFESITGCKHPLIASGATPIRSASLAPDEINTRIMKLERQDDSMLEPILKKLSTIASGATTIGSTGRAPDDNRKHRLLIGTIIDFIVDKIKSKWSHYHWERFATS